MIITCPNELPAKKDKWYVFLAGPIQGAPEWQFTLPEVDNVIWLSPRRKDYTNFNWDEQVKWETQCMLMSDIILFYVPREVKHEPNRSYAQTTRTEFGEYLARGKRVIFGCYSDFPGKRSFEAKIDQYDNGSQFVTNDNESLVLEFCINWIKAFIRDHDAQSYFTSDTHFSSQRALELSRRPFTSVDDMDWTMIQRWNDKIHPGDKVYHLGDFGEWWPAQYLNGDITLILGNYEEKPNALDGIPDWITVEPYIILDDLILAHEPVRAKNLLMENPKCKYALYGHIHGRQMIKRFGMDVGVDCNNFTPMSMNDVKFFINALNKEYYDEEVWVQ